MAALSCIDRSIQCLLSPAQPDHPDLHKPRGPHNYSTATITTAALDNKHMNAFKKDQATKASRLKSSKKGPTKQPKSDTGKSEAQKSASPWPPTDVGLILARRLRPRVSLLPVPLGASDQDAPHLDCKGTLQKGVKRTAQLRDMLTLGAMLKNPMPVLECTSSDEGRKDVSDSDRILQTDHNVNACGGEDKQVTGADLNANARRTMPKKARAVAKRRSFRRPPLRRNACAGTRIVNFSTLKPISAACSRSGLGLVVTYRPIFAETTKKKRTFTTRKQCRNNSQINTANNNVQISTAPALRESGTNPRTPSPEKRRRNDSSPRFFEQGNTTTKRQRSRERDQGVKRWLRDMPRSSSPRVRKHHSPSTALDDKHSARGPHGDVHQSARKSPIPGPSWDPEELRQPGSRSRSPFYMPTRRSASSSRDSSPRHTVISPRMLSPRSRSTSSGPGVKEVFAGRSPNRTPMHHVASRGHRRHSSSLSPSLPVQPAASEGWDVLAKPTAGKGGRNVSPPSDGPRDRGGGGKHRSSRKKEVSTTYGPGVRETRRHVASRSRSRSGSMSDMPMSSSSSESQRSRARRKVVYKKRERLPKQHGRHRRRHRHSRRSSSHERDDDDRGSGKKAINACLVM